MRSRLPSPIAGMAGEELGHAHRAGRRRRVGERAAQQLLRRDDAHRDILLERGARAAGGDGATGCRDAVDLGRARQRAGGWGGAPSEACACQPFDHHGTRSRALDRRGEPSGPAARMLRLSRRDHARRGCAEAAREGRAGPAPWWPKPGREDRRGRARTRPEPGIRPVHGGADDEADARPLPRRASSRALRAETSRDDRAPRPSRPPSSARALGGERIGLLVAARTNTPLPCALGERRTCPRAIPTPRNGFAVMRVGLERRAGRQPRLARTHPSSCRCRRASRRRSRSARPRGRRRGRPRARRSPAEP